MTKRVNAMDQLSALYEAVKRYPGGVEAMAARLPGRGPARMSPSTLYAILRGDEALTVDRQDMIIHYLRQAKVEGWAQVLHAKAAEHGCILIEAPDSEQETDVLTAAMLNCVEDFGNWAAESAQDIADREVTNRELERILEKSYETVSAIMAFVEMCRRVNAGDRCR